MLSTELAKKGSFRQDVFQRDRTTNSMCKITIPAFVLLNLESEEQKRIWWLGELSSTVTVTDLQSHRKQKASHGNILAVSLSCPLCHFIFFGGLCQKWQSEEVWNKLTSYCNHFLLSFQIFCFAGEIWLILKTTVHIDIIGFTRVHVICNTSNFFHLSPEYRVFLYLRDICDIVMLAVMLCWLCVDCRWKLGFNSVSNKRKKTREREFRGLVKAFRKCLVLSPF